MSGMQERAVRAVELSVRGLNMDCDWSDDDRATFYADVQTRLAAVLAVAADVPGLAEAIREHQAAGGMQVASGVTCRCGYWNGNEVAGKTRPVGFSGLQWHQAEMLAAYLTDAS